MNTEINEISIRLDNLTMLHLKIQQLEANKPWPKNHYQILEGLINEYDNCRDKLIEALIAKNTPNVLLKITPPLTVSEFEDLPF